MELEVNAKVGGLVLAVASNVSLGNNIILSNWSRSPFLWFFAFFSSLNFVNTLYIYMLYRVFPFLIFFPYWVLHMLLLNWLLLKKVEQIISGNSSFSKQYPCINWYWSWWKDKPLFSYEVFVPSVESIQVWIWYFTLRSGKLKVDHSLVSSMGWLDILL